MIFAKTMTLLHLALLTIGAGRKIPNKLGTSLYRFRKYTETFSNGVLNRIIIITPCEHHFCQIENGGRGVAVSRRLPSSFLAQAWHLFSLSPIFSYFLAPFLSFSSFSGIFFLYSLFADNRRVAAGASMRLCLDICCSLLMNSVME